MFELQAAGAGDPLEHVAVGGEVVLVGDQRAQRRVGVQHRVDELVEVDRGGVGDEHLAGLGADHLGQRVAGPPSAPRSSRASRRRAPRPTGRPRGAAARACPSAAGRASCRRGRAGARRRSRSGRGTTPAGRARPAARASSRVRAMRPPPSRAGCPDRGGRSGPRRARRSGVAPEASANVSLISTGTMSSSPPWVSRAGTPSGRRSIGEATLRRMPAAGSGRRPRWRGSARRRARDRARPPGRRRR